MTWANLSTIGMVDNASYNTTYGPESMTSDEQFHLYLYVIIVPILFGLITLIGATGNSLVIYVILSKEKMRTSINMTLLNLALADFAFILVCVPLTAYHYAADMWKLGDVVCKSYQFMLYVTAYVTTFTLVLVSALRFIAVVYGTRSSRYRNKRNVCAVIAMIWVTMMVANIPIFFIYRVKMFPLVVGDAKVAYFYCGLQGKSTGQKLFLIMFLVGYILPLGTICTLYLLLLRFLRKRKESSIRLRGGSERSAKHVQTGTTHVTRVIIAVVVVFGICWLPMHVHLLLTYYGKHPGDKMYQVFRVFGHCLAYANSCMNPIIYNYVSKDFRQYFRETFQCGASWRTVRTTHHVDANVIEMRNGLKATESTALTVEMERSLSFS